MSSLYSRGSEWRKWDLHFHTPSSFDYKYKSATPSQIINTLIENEIALVAITDHHAINIDFINKLKNESKDRITILPGIELRTELGGSDCVHIIGIFPEYADLDLLQVKLIGHLNITEQDIQQIGNDKLYVPYKDAFNKIIELGGIISIHAGEKTNGLKEIKNIWPHFQQFKKDISSSYIDIFEVGKLTDVEEYYEIVYPNIGFELPLVLCSDNHDIRDYTLRQNCWFKANPTFHGLKQILIEPTERVFIGDKPLALDRLEKNQDKIIRTIEIKKNDKSQLDENWFATKIDINPELVAIIGNKGSGKSALADIISLMGNTKNDNFSFLTNKRFKKRNPINRASCFKARLTWYNNTQVIYDPIDKMPDIEQPEKIKYIPQNFLDKVCNEFDNSFQSELYNVIFSHIPPEIKHGSKSLEELYNGQIYGQNESINILKEKIHKINEKIVSYQYLTSDSYKQKIMHLYTQKVEEIKTHTKIKPIKVKDPSKEEAVKKENEEILIQLNELNKEFDSVNKNILQKSDNLSLVNKKIDGYNAIKNTVQNIHMYIDEQIKIIKDKFELVSLKVTDILSLKSDISLINNRLEELNTDKIELLKFFDENLETSLVYKIKVINKKKEALEKSLSVHQKAFEAYKTNLREWKDAHILLYGSIEKDKTYYYYKSLLRRIPNEFVTFLDSLKKERVEMSTEIYKKKLEMLSFYKTYYSYIQNRLNKHPLSIKKLLKITFSAKLEYGNFLDQFLEKVNQARKGPFFSKEEGDKNIKDRIDNTDFDEEESAILFITSIIDDMFSQNGDEGRYKKTIDEQLVQSVSEVDFYDFVFSMEYIDPMFSILWDNKDLNQLSPGEKGILLLVFYLLLETNNIPIVFDQPEENLGSETISSIVVPCIKEARKNRQVIIVTHNPNLAVYCDADQVIYAEMHKDKKNEIIYISGAIEDENINPHLVNTLEGTRPAFKNRGQKYDIFN